MAPPRDLLRARLRTRRDRDDRAHPVRIGDRPLEHLHPAHRAADHRVPPAHAEVVGEPGVHPHHVSDRHDGEPGAEGAAGDRIGRRRAGRPLATAEHVRAHHVPAVRVDRAPRSDHPLPPAGGRVAGAHRPGRMAVPRPGVTQQHGVRLPLVERAPRLVGGHDLAQRSPAVERERTIGGGDVEAAPTDRVAVLPRATGRRRLATGYYLHSCAPLSR